MLKNRPGENGSKLPSIDGLDQSSNNLKKIASGALVIQTRQKPKRNSIDLKPLKEDTTPRNKKDEPLGYELHSRRGKSSLDNAPLKPVISKKHKHLSNLLELDIENDNNLHPVIKPSHHF